MTVVGNVPAQLVNNPPAQYSFTPSTPLAGSTTYYWKVVSRTQRHAARPEHGRVLVGCSRSRRPPARRWRRRPPELVPSPWQTQDVGSVGASGSASFSNGVFTVAGRRRGHLGYGRRVPVCVSGL